jgi:hypothetical protein
MKQPFFHACAAEAYIILVVAFVTRVFPFAAEEPDSILAPITMISLLVLSVATMAYLFFSVPVCQYLDGNKEYAVKFLTSTILYFAGLTMAVAITMIVTSRM